MTTNLAAQALSSASFLGCPMFGALHASVSLQIRWIGGLLGCGRRRWPGFPILSE